jgi:hypothetical protein
VRLKSLSAAACVVALAACAQAPNRANSSRSTQPAAATPPPAPAPIQSSTVPETIDASGPGCSLKALFDEVSNARAIGWVEVFSVAPTDELVQGAEMLLVETELGSLLVYNEPIDPSVEEAREPHAIPTEGTVVRYYLIPWLDGAQVAQVEVVEQAGVPPDVRYCDGLLGDINEQIDAQGEITGMSREEFVRLMLAGDLAALQPPPEPVLTWYDADWTQRDLLPGVAPEDVINALTPAILYLRLPALTDETWKALDGAQLCSRIADLGRNSCVLLSQEGINGPAPIAIHSGVLEVFLNVPNVGEVPLARARTEQAVTALVADPTLVMGVDITELTVDGTAVNAAGTLGLFPPDPAAKLAAVPLAEFDTRPK